MTSPRLAFVFGSLLFASCSDDASIGRLSGKLTTTDTIDFGRVQLGLVATYDLEVDSDGSVGVIVSDTKVAANFVDSKYQFKILDKSFVLGPRDKKHIQVTFQPFEEQADPFESSFSFVTDIKQSGMPLEVQVKVKGWGVKNGLGVEPNPVDFGAVLVGSSRTMDVKITNLLSAPVDVTSQVGTDGRALITQQGGHGHFELLSPLSNHGSLLAANTKLAASESITVQLRYTPDPTETNVSDRATWVIANCDNALCEVPVRLGGHGTNTGIECTPAAVDFGAINPGRVATRSITCTNLSTGDVTITDWSMDAGSAPELTVGPFAGQILGPQQSLTLDASFSPTTATLGVRVMGSITVSTRSESARRDLEPVKVTLTGEGGGPTIIVQPMQLDFGRVAIGTTNTKRLLVQNAGYSDLVVSMVAADGADAAMFAPMPDLFTLATGTSTIVEVAFGPTAEAPAAADLVFDSNDGSTPHLRVPMRGIGVALPPCNYSVTPSNVSFGVVLARETASQTVRVNNLGTDDCLVTELELTGDPEFALANGPVASETIPPGLSLDVPLTYTPAHAGNNSALIGFYISSPSDPNPTVPVYGVGQAQTEVVCPPPVTTPAGVPVTLTANATTNGTTVTGYEWAITSAPNGGIGTPGQWMPDPPTSSTETFLPYIVGAYVIHVTVTDDQGNTMSCDTQVVAEGHGLRVQLTWDGPGDIDLHVHNQNVTAWFSQSPGGIDDCYYADRTPQWNPTQPAAVGENPQLDFDNVTANGPENTRVDTVVVGQPYTIAAHNFSRGAGRVATVDIFCGGVTTPTQTFTSPVFVGTSAGQNGGNDFWKVATVVFTSQTSCAITPINTVVLDTAAYVAF